MEKKSSSSIIDIVVTYGVTITSIILAFTLGAYALAASIAMFADEIASLPSIFGILGGGGSMSLITTSALAVIFAIVAHMGMKKVSASSDVATLTASDEYRTINKVAKAICFIGGAMAVVAALAVVLTAVLTIDNYTPWKSYLVGSFLPLLIVAAGLFGAGIAINMFTKATLKPAMLTIITLGIAIVGIVLAFVAVLVDAHVDRTPSSIKSIYDSILD